MLNADETQKLLDKLCVELGFCLPPEGADRLRVDPPADAASFAEAVFREEGMDPETADRRLFRQVRDLVADALRRAEYGGA